MNCFTSISKSSLTMIHPKYLTLTKRGSISQTDDVYLSDRQHGAASLKEKDKRSKEKTLLADLQNTADQSRIS